MKQPSTATRALVTSALVLTATAGVAWKFWDYYNNPWTRNGRVMAQVIQITPRVSGWIVDLPIVDNQFVKQCDLLVPDRSAHLRIDACRDERSAGRDEG